MVKVDVGGSVINKATPSSLSPWPEHMPMLIKYKIAGTLAGYLSIIVEQVLENGQGQNIGECCCFLTPFKLCFIQKNIY